MGAFAACVRLLLPLAPAPAAFAPDAAGAAPAMDLPTDAPPFAAGAHLGSAPPTLDSGPAASAQSPAQLPSPGSVGNFAASAGDSINPSATAAIAPQAAAGNSSGIMAGAMDALSIGT